MTQLAERNGAVAPVISATVMESVLIGGDLSKLSVPERMSYYKAVCESVGLNPLTKPFAYIQLNGKLQLYALKDCTEQLRKIHGVSIERLERQVIEGCYVVTAYAKDKGGRTDGSTGAVTVTNLKGEALANAYMKAETKAKRRVTLSICGLGMLDETEAASIPGAQVISAEIQPMPTDSAELHGLVGTVSVDARQAALDAAVAAHQDTILCVKEGLRDGDLVRAAEAWYELSEDEMQALWVAPTKFKNAPFTTEERTAMRSAEFRSAHGGKNASV